MLFGDESRSVTSLEDMSDPFQRATLSVTSYIVRRCHQKDVRKPDLPEPHFSLFRTGYISL